jgi:hypothetical protein
MSTTSRLAMFSQVLGGLFAAVVLFGFLWTNINGSGGLIPAFAIVCAATLAFARQKGDALLADLRQWRLCGRASVKMRVPAKSPVAPGS